MHYFFFAMFCAWAGALQATHIRGGYLEIKEVTGTTVTFSFMGWQEGGSSVMFGSGILDFGDGTTSTRDFQVHTTSVNGGVMVYFEVVHHYSGAGQYRVSYKEDFRNDGILNCDNSVGTSFYTELRFSLDPFVQNQYPRIDPKIVFDAHAGVPLHSGILAQDADGDLLVYQMIVPKQDRFFEVNNYRHHSNESFYTNYQNAAGDGIPVFKLHPYTGNLLWDVPGDQMSLRGDKAEYVTAIQVSEFRRINGVWSRLSSTVVDFNMVVYPESPEVAPEVEMSSTACGTFGSLEVIIRQCAGCMLEPGFPFFTLEQNGSAVTPDTNGQVVLEEQEERFTLRLADDVVVPGFANGSVKLWQSGRLIHSQNLLYHADCEVMEEVVINALDVAPRQVEVLVFPNPTDGQITIRGTSSDFVVEVTDLTGKVLYTQAVKHTHSKSVQLPDTLRNGWYLMSIADLQGNRLGLTRIWLTR